MSARSLATVTNATQAESATKTSLLKHAGVKRADTKLPQSAEEKAEKNSSQKSPFKQDFSCIPVSNASDPVIQPKLVVGQPNTRYEQEADRIAEQVMRMPDPVAVSSKSRFGLAQSLPIQRFKADTSKKLQRQVEEPEEESDEEEAIQAKLLPSVSIEPLNSLQGEQLQRQADELQEATEEDEDEESEPIQAKILSPLPIQTLNASSEAQIQRQADELQEAQPDNEDEEEPVQAKGMPLRTPKVTSELASRLKANRGGGQPLTDSIREFMESRFNYDFSRVRVHTDGQANQLARSLNAQAFTFKQDIYFGAGYYQPQTSSGKRLLAHELTHTIQQQPNPLAKPHTLFKPPTPLSKVGAELGQAPKRTSTEELSDRTSRLLPTIVNSVPETQSLVSRRAAKPSPAEPMALTPEQIAKLESEDDLEGPFAPPSTQKSTSTPGTADSDQAKPKVTPPSEERVEGKEAIEEEPEEKTEDLSAATAEGEGAVAEKSPTSPKEDPAFQAVVKRTKGVAKQQQKHAPASAESKKAQDAAEPPKNEVESKAQDQQVQDMDQQQPGTFSADEFVEALLKKIANIVPNNEDDAKEFKENNRVNSVKQEVSSQVSQEKQQASDPIDKKNKEAPNTAGIDPKPVKPLEKQDAGPPPPNLNADQAAPKPKTEAEVTEPFKQNSESLDQQMSEADITNEQLERSNETQFTDALSAKKDAQKDAATAPDAYRKDEQSVLTRAEGQADETGQKQTGAMHGQREQLLNQVQAQQTQTKGKDEQERTKVANDINSIYEKTKKDVEEILNSLDAEVDKQFDAGAEVAKKAFVDYVDREMDAYKDKRYGAWYDVSGWGTRVRDAFKGLPPEVNIIFVKGREIYVNSMHTTLKGIANYVADTLNRAKQRIADGKKEIQKYVAGLSPELQKFGQDAEKNIQEKFDALEEQVNSKQEELIDSLAQKYQENLKAIDEDIKKRQEDNKGWIDKAKDKIQGVIETINKLKQMFQQILARVQEVAALIIKDPIGFLKNLVGGLKQGFENFVSNIAKHLQSGFIAWLTGALGPSGITIPDDVFSLKGIFSLVLQVLNLTWPVIRGIAAKVFGEPIIAALEKGVEKGAEIFQILVKEGPIGLWEHIKEQFTDLKATLMDQIQDMLITQVIQAGVKWILGLLNPVAAFVKAAMAIYDIVMFFVERAQQIADFINSVIDAIAAIAKGQVSGVAKLIENALARSVPLIIGLLASLLGVGNLAKKVQAFFQKIHKKVVGAIEKFMLKIKKSKLFRTISKKVKGVIKKVKKKVKAFKKKAKAFVKKVKKKVKAFAKKTKKKVKAVKSAIVEWWKAKKQFTSLDGESHTLSFAGKEGNAKLMISSQPKTYSKFIQMIDVKNQPKQIQDAKEKAKVIAKEIDSLIKQRKGKGGGVQTKEGRKIKDDIIKKLNELAVETIKLAGVTEIPPSVIEYGPLTPLGCGTLMDAKILSEKNTKGSRPKDKPEIWTTANRRKGIYVQGHLLNQRLGGPGQAFNLAPITRSANAQHSTSAETDIKKTVFDDHEVVRYRVKVKRGKHPQRSSQKAVEDRLKNGISKNPTKDHKKLDFMKFEQSQLPMGFVIDWAILEYKKGKWKDKKKITQGHLISSDLPDEEPII